MIPLCVPTLNRYDHLRTLLESVRDSVVKPSVIHLLNNGRDYARMVHAISVGGLGVPIEVKTPAQPLGLAESWNYFYTVTQEVAARLIVNDDVTFPPEALRQLFTAKGQFLSALAGSNAFSCFVWRNTVVDMVGLFDETISPGYAYFEDNDYAERMTAAGVSLTSVECGVGHAHSQTVAAFTPEEMARHHVRFKLAKENYRKKHGRLPEGCRE